jgi:hypothetical protein
LRARRGGGCIVLSRFDEGKMKAFSRVLAARCHTSPTREAAAQPVAAGDSVKQGEIPLFCRRGYRWIRLFWLI